MTAPPASATTAPDVGKPASEPGQGTGTGRGLLSITAAKLYFIVAGFAVQVGLPRLLGSTEAFGEYSAAMSTVSVLNNVLIAATIQSVSKRVSEAPEHADARLRQSLKIQLVLGALIGGGLFLAAPLLAAAQMDDALVPLLRIAALVPFFYAIYAALVGALNGQRQFQRQAALDATFSTLRTLGILGAAGLGLGVAGTISGFAGAAGAVLLTALVLVGVGRSGEPLPLRAWLGFMLPIAAFQLALNGTLLLDIQVLKRTLTEIGMSGGLGLAEAATQANHYVGLYRAGQTFALVPYQVILSVTFVVFPLVSQATASGDDAATRATIRNAMRFSLLVLLALAAPISGAADGVVRIAYTDEFLAGGDALRALVFGQSALALFVIGATIVNAAGSPTQSTLIGAVGLAIVLGANRVLLERVGIGEATLTTAGIATSLGPCVALLLVGTLVQLRYGVFIPLKTVARGALAAAVGFWVASRVPHPSAVTSLFAMSAGGLSYLAVLFGTLEVRKADLVGILSSLKTR